MYDDGTPVTATCDFRVLLYDAPIGGNQVGNTQIISDIAVVDGFFVLSLNFGAAAFEGDARYLDIAVRCGPEPSFTSFADRVTLTAAPYSLYALGAPWAGIGGIPADLADGDDNTTYTAGDGLALAGTTFSVLSDTVQLRIAEACPAGSSIRAIAQDGTVLCESDDNTTYTVTTGMTLIDTTLGLDTSFTDGRYWQLGGNTAALNADARHDRRPLADADCIGDTRTAALAGVCSLQMPPTLIGGSLENRAYAGTIGAVIAGGGPQDILGIGPNVIYDNMGVIGGGSGNVAGSDDADQTTAQFTTVGGGRENSASEEYASIGGGYQNSASGDISTIGGGFSNNLRGFGSVIAGGSFNTIYDSYTTIGGGFNNKAGSDTGSTVDADYATVAGGYDNVASEDSATVGGGYLNEASGYISTIAGGAGNIVQGEFGFIGGGGPQDIDNPLATSNRVYDNYGMIGGGSNNTAGTFGSDITNAMYATVGGGLSNTASGTYATVPGGRSNGASSDYSFAAGRRAIANDTGAFVWADSTDTNFFSSAPNQFRVRATGGVQFVTNSANTTGVTLAAGSGTWASISDRNAKMAFAPVDERAILEQVAQLPITTWQYRSEAGQVRHMGPMAQDFAAAFGLGDTNTTITTVDADGVALAAIQGLHALAQEQDAQITALQQDNAALLARLEALEQRIATRDTPHDAGLPLVAIIASIIGAGMLVVLRRTR
ncbi:MAG: hypothetical protein HC893_17315 [Chloroflexaceae bacterium]|nr:hypothetical protein [Chloroflexaceae bacterium]